jgi:hypothetical protein
MDIKVSEVGKIARNACSKYVYFFGVYIYILVMFATTVPTKKMQWLRKRQESE